MGICSHRATRRHSSGAAIALAPRAAGWLASVAPSGRMARLSRDARYSQLRHIRPLQLLRFRARRLGPREERLRLALGWALQNWPLKIEIELAEADH